MLIVVGRMARIKAKRSKRKRLLDCYVDRKNRLSRLGYASYAEYLASYEWKEIRAKKIGLRGVANGKPPKLCVACDKNATQVHHLDYSEKALLGLDFDLLARICDDCHREIEFDSEGNKRSLQCANERLFSLAQSRNLPHATKWITSAKRAILDAKTSSHKKQVKQRKAAKKRCHTEQRDNPNADALSAYRRNNASRPSAIANTLLKKQPRSNKQLPPTTKANKPSKSKTRQSKLVPGMSEQFKRLREQMKLERATHADA